MEIANSYADKTYAPSRVQRVQDREPDKHFDGASHQHESVPADGQEPFCHGA
jgi:hypothetical protein